MKKKRNTLHLFLLISVFFLTAGLYMTIDAHYKRLSIEVASNQIEFLKSLPQIVKKEELLELPLYQENIILDKNKCLKGYIKGDYYKGKISIRDLSVTVYRGNFRKAGLFCLLDARIRN